jgi:predicted small lipoprotein YifL
MRGYMQNAWVVMQNARLVIKRAVVLGLVCMAFAGGLVACGQKGPLYLPKQQSKPQPDVKAAPAVKPDAPAPVAAPENTEPS